MVTDTPARTLESRIERARELHATGHNCAQCVAMVFDDIVALDYPTLEMIAVSLGGGVCGTRGTCGCVSAMTMIAGIHLYAINPDKRAVYEIGRRRAEEFAALNGGHLLCEHLRQPGRKPCIKLIEEAVTILHNYYKSL